MEEDEVEDIVAEVRRDRCYRRDGPPGEKEYHLPNLVGYVQRFWKSVPFPEVGSLRFHRARRGDIT
jgi:hypothetical protein